MKRILFVLLALAALNAAPVYSEEIATTPTAYPLDTCVVSGEKLGEMGEPYVFDYNGREVRFCCKMCKKKFLKDPDTFLKKIDDAAAAKKAELDPGSSSDPAGNAGKNVNHNHE